MVELGIYLGISNRFGNGFDTECLLGWLSEGYRKETTAAVKVHDGFLLERSGHFLHRLEQIASGPRVVLEKSIGTDAVSREKRFDVPSLCLLGIAFIKESNLFNSVFGQNEDTIAAHICQFDFLQAVYLLHQGQSAYPNFGIFLNYRTEPIVSKLVRRTPVRQAFKDISDQELAQIIELLDEKAASAFFSFAGWDRSSWTDPAIKSFLQNHLPRN